MRISAQIGSEDIYAECDAEYGSVAEQLLALMNVQASRGNPVFEGMTIQFGWTVFTLKRRSGKLMLHEPDFDKNPTVDLRCDISCSISVYLRQQSVIADLGLSNWMPASCFDEVLAAHGSLSETRLIAKHYADRQGKTGWVMFHWEDTAPLTLDTLPDQYGTLAVWQLLHHRAGLLGYLALPAGYTVFLDKDKVERIINEDGDMWS